ncbi:MAG: hypothetical protein D6795_03535, partial [Deltaproteobacteria bacterium]
TDHGGIMLQRIPWMASLVWFGLLLPVYGGEAPAPAGKDTRQEILEWLEKGNLGPEATAEIRKWLEVGKETASPSETADEGGSDTSFKKGASPLQEGWKVVFRNDDDDEDDDEVLFWVEDDEDDEEEAPFPPLHRLMKWKGRGFDRLPLHVGGRTIVIYADSVVITGEPPHHGPPFDLPPHHGMDGGKGKCSNRPAIPPCCRHAGEKPYPKCKAAGKEKCKAAGKEKCKAAGKENANEPCPKCKAAGKDRPKCHGRRSWGFHPWPVPQGAPFEFEGGDEALPKGAEVTKNVEVTEEDGKKIVTITKRIVIPEKPAAKEEEGASSPTPESLPKEGETPQGEKADATSGKEHGVLEAPDPRIVDEILSSLDQEEESGR